MERLTMVLRTDGSRLWDWVNQHGQLVEWTGPPIGVNHKGYYVTGHKVIRR